MAVVAKGYESLLPVLDKGKVFQKEGGSVLFMAEAVMALASALASWSSLSPSMAPGRVARKAGALFLNSSH